MQYELQESTSKGLQKSLHKAVLQRWAVL